MKSVLLHPVRFKLCFCVRGTFSLKVKELPQSFAMKDVKAFEFWHWDGINCGTVRKVVSKSGVRAKCWSENT